MSKLNRAMKKKVKFMDETTLETDGIGDVLIIIRDGEQSRKLCTYLIEIKDEVFEVLKKFKSVVERKNNHKLKVLKTDGGGECFSKEFERFCDK